MCVFHFLISNKFNTKKLKIINTFLFCGLKQTTIFLINQFIYNRKSQKYIICIELKN